MMNRQADTIIFGKIHILDRRATRAEAIAIADGRVLASGRRDDIVGLRGPQTIVEDFGRATIFPGFNDTHAHMISVGMRSARPSLEGLRSIAEIQARIRELAARTPKGGWIVTMPIGTPPGYFDGASVLAEGRWPNRRELDAAAPDHPVYISLPHGYWGQMPLQASMNSKALQLNGVDRETRPSMPGIEIEKDESGEPTGVFRERNFASLLEADILRAVPRFDAGDRLGALRRAIGLFHAKGTTSIYEGHGSAPDVIAAFRALRQSGELTVRTGLCVAPTWNDPDGAENVMRTALPYARGSGLGDETLRVSGVFISCYGNTRANPLFQRDPDDLGWSDYNRAVNDTEGFEQLCLLAAKYDLRVHTVVSDRLKDVIPVFEKVAARYPLAGRRWVAEHISAASHAGLEALRDLGIGVTLIPLGHVWKLGENFKDTPDSPLDLVVPAKALSEMGVPVAAATDGAPHDPLVTLWSLVNRKTKQTGNVVGPGGCMRNEDALRLLTVAGSWLTFDENIKGPLLPGYLADLVVFERDPLVTQGDEILENACLATMVGGAWVHRTS